VPAVIDPNEHLESALESHVCMVDDSRQMVLDLKFQPKFLHCGVLRIVLFEAFRWKALVRDSWLEFSLEHFQTGQWQPMDLN
jgi:hypothetical protein